MLPSLYDFVIPVPGTKAVLTASCAISSTVVSRTTIPVAFGKVIVWSAVGFVTVRVVSKASADDPSKIILDFGINKFPSTSNFAGPPALPTSDSNT